MKHCDSIHIELKSSKINSRYKIQHPVLPWAQDTILLEKLLIGFT